MITAAAHVLSLTLGSDTFLCSWRLESFCQRTWPAGRTNAVTLPMSPTVWCPWLKVCALQWPTLLRRLHPSSATAGWGHQLPHYVMSTVCRPVVLWIHTCIFLYLYSPTRMHWFRHLHCRLRRVLWPACSIRSPPDRTESLVSITLHVR